MGTSREWAARMKRAKGVNDALPTNDSGPGDATQEGVEKHKGVATGQSCTQEGLTSGLCARTVRGWRTACAAAAETVS